ncbi:MAG: hypothetical protein WA162_06020 [Thermodesulfobacteriota bacterium]
MSEEEAKTHFLDGMKHLRKNSMEDACKEFEKACKLEKENPRYMSYYGMCAALRWGKIGLGLELCTKAIKKEFFKTEYYINLGKVYMASGNKKGAITVLSKGLRFDTDNEEIHNLLVELGVRKRPVIPFLKRSNPLNKVLGIFMRRTLPGIMGKTETSEEIPENPPEEPGKNKKP